MTSNMFSVTNALSSVAMDNNMRTLIESNRQVWEYFGKMNSHLYRNQLFTSMLDSNLSAEAKFMVFVFFAAIKNKDRVLKHMDLMDEDMKSAAWFAPVRAFIATKVVQYVTQAEKSKKFPAVNIPSSMPGFDILAWCLITTKENRTLENLFMRTTASQLTLNPVMQSRAKEGYAKYWNEIVKGSRNPDSPEAPKMREEYYANSESDKYMLITFRNEKFVEVKPNDTTSGYGENELKTYLSSFN